MTKSKLIEIDPLKLPADWCVSNIDSVASYIQRGKSPKYTEKSDLPVINQKCVRWDGIDREHQKYIHPEQYEKWTPERFLVDGDILWNSTGTGTIGRASLVHLADGERLVADSHITIVRPAKGIEPKYLHYWIMGHEVQNSIGAVQSGSTNQVELSKGAVQATPIPLAPTRTQKIIVNKIEELFSHIDAGVEG
ncbi:restriction endonuclease subunit S, partial [Vibrio cholerae]|nr:restriction endonuclease subunit S [Vibrio cholerae]